MSLSLLLCVCPQLTEVDQAGLEADRKARQNASAAADAANSESEHNAAAAAAARTALMEAQAASTNLTRRLELAEKAVAEANARSDGMHDEITDLKLQIIKLKDGVAVAEAALKKARAERNQSEADDTKDQHTIRQLESKLGKGFSPCLLCSPQTNTPYLLRARQHTG